MNERKPILILGLVTTSLIGRLAPHLPDATPLSAISLSAREHLGARAAYAIVFSTMLATDALLGFYDWRLMLSVYASVALMTALNALRPRGSGIMTALSFAFLGAFLFFAITNAAVWALSPWYAKSIAGLFTCLVAGLPFLRTMLLGDALYVPAVHFAARLLMKYAPARGTRELLVKPSANRG